MSQAALRPLEWYRLALVHGPFAQPLNEENYSDGGISLSPDHEIEEEPDVLRAPVLADVRDDIDKLWKHTLTRRHLKPKLLAAWRSHPKAVVAAFLTRMWQARKDEHARGRMLELCVKCLGRAGADVVRRAWADYKRAKPKMRKVRLKRALNPDEEAAEFQRGINQMLKEFADAEKDPESDDRLSVSRRAMREKMERLAAERDEKGGDDEDENEAWMRHLTVPDPAGVSVDALADASAVCLPADEGYARVLEVLESIPEGGRVRLLDLLAPFGSPRTLDWMETRVERPVTEGWGELAAKSGLDWARVVAWLEKGRPMSHVALDALRFLVFPGGDPDDDYFELRLIDPPNRKTLNQVLKAHAERDPVPRVQDRVEFVLSYPEVLLDGKPYKSK